MATVLPPPSKRQKREVLERSQTQQDVTSHTIAGSIRARFVDSDGKELAETVEIPLADATERNVSSLLNTLLQRDREDFTPYRFRIQIPNSNTVIDSYPNPSEFLEVLRKHGVENPFETTLSFTAEPQSVFKVQAATRMAHRLSAVTMVRWGGLDHIYSASQDRQIKVWNASDGTLRHSLNSHAHWVNHITLSTDSVLRTGFYDHTKVVPSSLEEKKAKAKARFEKAATHGGKIVEKLVSASDDCTVFLWDPESQGSKPVTRLMGHTKQINFVAFSPDGRLIATASFDNSIKIFDREGKFLASLRGHVAPVFQLAFSADSRLLASCSRDTTLKTWDMRTFKLKTDLPGHEDEVWALDWSPDGTCVASGGAPSRSGRKASLPGKPGALKRVPPNSRPSLFTTRPVNSPPLTPPEDETAIEDDLFLNRDGLPTHASNDAEFRVPADKESPSWGGLTFQPISRANSPPPASILEHEKTFEKAKELGRQGIFQPRTSRSDSHDRVFANANWRIVNADQGNGGLRNAAEAAARDGYNGEFTWVGTLGMPTDALEGTQQKNDICDRLATEFSMLPVFCSDKDFNGHYSHFCKQILWPVFHYQIPDNPKSKAYEDHSWQFYVNVNQSFADKIVKNWKRGDTIWIHDYHLLLLPGMIRKKLPDAKIGLFLHVAFPSSEVFRCLAIRKQLLEGMLGANLIGFQIAEYTRHFLQTCSRLLSVEATSQGIQLEDRFVDVTHTAIGIDPVSLNLHRQDPEVMKWVNIMRDRYKGKKIIVARDKLDLVRGVRQKLLAFELFLNKNPSWRDKIVLIQVALSTSEKNGGLDAAIGDIVARINSAWANLAYQPVVYLKQDIPYSQYLALLTIADALMITSQREGMNLTSHEFIVCQDGAHCDQKHGSLILSEFTGTSSLFWGPGAVDMSSEERASRWSSLREVVSRQTGSHWFASFLSQLDQSYEVQHRQDQISVPRLNLGQLAEKYRQSQRRLFLLDFEGTLIPHETVKDKVPANPQRTLAVLNDLVYYDENTVFVMSARKCDELDRLFRVVPNLGLVAENGCFIKYPGGNSWTEFADRRKVAAWKQSVRNILQYYLERTPGNAEDFGMAERQASDWTAHINESCEDQHVHATQLEDSVVVESCDWTKDTAATHIYEQVKTDGESGNHSSPPDFLMVIGDGREDEKVFRWANKLQEDGDVKEAITVTLSNRNTDAKTTLTQGVSGVLLTLLKLASLS
ncbi:hypothetical protein NUW58_g2668 [Xylaria curta]|uniref:Uncharacterized protein n=1 Tax=Xylaria curta TaxID=42375 RepID=A0ACC1PHN5_9PEZI|nr:hypothetical protein NUW58_g2668 [Xylaria curta]